jgi:RNA polymerase sigma-70 factor (ECF subfamily)
MLSIAARILPGIASASAVDAESNAPRLRMESTESAGASVLPQIEDLGQRCKEGEFAAWTELFPLVWPSLVTFINRLYHSLDQQDAEDVAQTSIEAAIQGIDDFSGEGVFRAWLFGIASRQARALFRRKSAAKRDVALLVPISDARDRIDPAAKSPADATAETDRAAILHRALEQLSEDDRDLVQLHYFGELTFKEIAGVRRMNPKTVCTRITRSKQKLLDLLIRSNLTRADG